MIFIPSGWVKQQRAQVLPATAVAMQVKHLVESPDHAQTHSYTQLTKCQTVQDRCHNVGPDLVFIVHNFQLENLYVICLQLIMIIFKESFSSWHVDCEAFERAMNIIDEGVIDRTRAERKMLPGSFTTFFAVGAGVGPKEIVNGVKQQLPGMRRRGEGINQGTARGTWQFATNGM